MQSLIRKTIPELLTHISLLDVTRKVKQDILFKSVDASTHQILEFLYNPEYQFSLLKKFKYTSETARGRGVRRLEKYVYVISLLEDTTNISLDKKESMLYQMCECLDKEEVEMVLGIIKGKSTINGISKHFLFDTFNKPAEL